jgi:hypothetical protein
MNTTRQIVSLFAVLVLAIVLATTSVSAQISVSDISVEANGVEDAQASTNLAAFAGQVIPVRVTFTADGASTDVAQDVRVKVWLAGDSQYSATSERFDVIGGSTYSRLVLLEVPSNIDPTETFRLQVSLESRSEGVIGEAFVNVAAQRESYKIEVLDVNVPTKATSGTALPLDIVLKNRGSHFSTDTFVKVSIPALGLENRAYFGDLSAVDQADPDKEDAAERRIFLNIPRNTPAGVYVVEVEAYSADDQTTVTKKVAIVGSSDDSQVVSSVTTRTVATGETADYTITLINSGDKAQVYQISAESADNVNVNADQQYVVIPAGSSKDVKVSASAEKAGRYTFDVNILSNGDVVKKQSLVLNAEGSKVFAGNWTILLTVILAIIFIVLLVVLVVLLTRKPAKSEEFGESYY